MSKKKSVFNGRFLGAFMITVLLGFFYKYWAHDRDMQIGIIVAIFLAYVLPEFIVHREQYK